MNPSCHSVTVPLALTAVLCLFPFSASTHAEVFPLGGEVQVNAYTTGDQSRPSVALHSDGSFIVVWDSEGSVDSDSSLTSIQAQRFDSTGARLGAPFQVNTTTQDDQEEPQVATGPDGDFIVVWTSDASTGNDDDTTSIQAQRFDAAGQPLGGEFQVNTYTYFVQSRPAVAVDDDGDFVVTWQSYFSDGAFFNIQSQRFDSAGVPQGSEFQVNQLTSYYQRNPDVAFNQDGEFTVVWDTIYSFGDDDDGSIQGRRFGSDGTPLTGEFQISTYTTYAQNHPSLGTDGQGNMVVVWQSQGSQGSSTSALTVLGQRLDSGGALVGPEFPVNPFEPDNFNRSPAVSMDPSGEFIVAWEHVDYGAFAVRARSFDASAAPQEAPFTVPTSTAGRQGTPAVATGGDGKTTVLWQSESSADDDTDGTSIQLQRLQLSLFRDGFESGDVSAWSTSAP